MLLPAARRLEQWIEGDLGRWSSRATTSEDANCRKANGS